MKFSYNILLTSLAVSILVFSFTGCASNKLTEELSADKNSHSAIEIRIPHGLSEIDSVHIGFEAFKTKSALESI